MSAAHNRIHSRLSVPRNIGRATTPMPIVARRLEGIPQLSSTEPNRRSWSLTVAFSFAVLAVLAAVSFYGPWRSGRSVAAESHTAKTVKVVNVTSPTPASASNVMLPATFRAWQTATLVSRASGFLKAWRFDLGSSVKAGDILAEIETPELDQEVAQAQALASEANAAIVQAQAERVESQADLKVAEAQLVRAQAEYELAKSQLVRRDSLVRSRSIAQEEYDTFQRQLEARAAEVAAAQSDVVRRRTNLETRAASIQAREATAKSRQANVDRLKELQSFKHIVAPFDGVITSRTADVGMLVTAGKDPLFVIEDLSRIRVQLNVPQTYAMQIAPGVSAMVSLPESKSLPVQAEITRIADSVDSASRTMLAEIELDNSESHFQPGSYAQVTLLTPQSAEQWTVSANTISMRVNGPHLAAVNEQNEIEMRPVTLGRDLGDRVVVASGISGSERLVVNPGDDLASGVQVEVHREAEPGRKVAQQ